ncbi:hypothetical protein DITRI_Ditri19aG0107300 [Diplodiscus trichospermus]
MATSNERDERRRRMAEKGLNRMSHITLDAKKDSFDANSDERRKTAERGLNRPSRITTQSNPPILEHHALFPKDHQAPQTYPSNQISAASVGNYLKQSVIHKIPSANSLDVRGQAELKLQKPETDKDAISALVVGKKDGLRPMQGTSSLQKATTNAETLQRNQSNFFSSKRVNSCIIASERTRSFCALLIALFVLLSHIDSPLLGMNIVRSESIVASRPLFMIFLTDLTVVLGRLFLDKKGDSEEDEEEKTGIQNNKRNWEGAVKLLERGLVVYQTIRGLFIDFSIYAVVVICGLSLV